VNVKGIPQSTSFTLQYSVNGGSYSTAVSSANNRGVNAEVPSTGSSEVKIRVNRSGAYREYTVTLVKPGPSPTPTPPPSEGLPEGIAALFVDTELEPFAQTYITAAVIHITPGYENRFEPGSITFPSLGNKTATKQANGTWYVGFPVSTSEGYSRAQVLAAMVVRLTGGSQGEIPIEQPAGGWPEPIDRITKMDDPEPFAQSNFTTVFVYIKDDAVLSALGAVTVNGKSATSIEDRKYWVQFPNIRVDDFVLNTVTANYSYTPPGPPDEVTGLIDESRTRVFFDPMVRGGYVASVYVRASSGDAVVEITIRDKDTGTLLASYPSELDRVGNNLFQGLVESSTSPITRTVAINVKAGSHGEQTVDSDYISS
jgi:hypothetical protein